MKEKLISDELQITMFCQSGVLPVSKTSVYSVMGHLELYIWLSVVVWLRTVFAGVIGDVGVIIEDLEEQQSYFGLIDFFFFFWLPLAMWGRNSNPQLFFTESNRAPPEATVTCSFKIWSLGILLDILGGTSDLGCLGCPVALFCCQFNLHVMHLVHILTSIKIAWLCQTPGFAV